MSEPKEVRFIGHEESSSEDDAHGVDALTFEAAAAAIAELQDGEDEMIQPERRIVLWPWGWPQLKKTFIVDAKLVYVTREEVPHE